MRKWKQEAILWTRRYKISSEPEKYYQSNYFCIIHGLLSQISLQDSTHIMSHTSANKRQYIQMPTISMMIVRYLICHQKILTTMYLNQYGIQYLQIFRMMKPMDLQLFKSWQKNSFQTWTLHYKIMTHIQSKTHYQDFTQKLQTGNISVFKSIAHTSGH